MATIVTINLIFVASDTMIGALPEDIWGVIVQYPAAGAVARLCRRLRVIAYDHYASLPRIFTRDGVELKYGGVRVVVSKRHIHDRLEFEVTHNRSSMTAFISDKCDQCKIRPGCFCDIKPDISAAPFKMTVSYTLLKTDWVILWPQ